MMKNPNILIVDSDDKNLKILSKNYIQADYSVSQAESMEKALLLLKQNDFDFVLTELETHKIDGYKILEHIQRQYVYRNTQVIFITQKSDIWNRIKSFKLGVKDYIVKPTHAHEVVARTGMLYSRLQKRLAEKDIFQKKFTGRLEDLNLVQLVQALGMEKKTGILNLYNDNGSSGKIFFNNGVVLNAAFNKFPAEDAIYKMLSWHKGRFSMLFCSVNTENKISISNMGLLLQGVRIMEQREDLLKQLPSLNAVLVTTSNFKNIIDSQELEPDLEKFISLFDGERNLHRIIDDSKYDELTTLKRIVKLYSLGFLHVLKDFKAPRKSEPANQIQTPKPEERHPSPPPKKEPGKKKDESKQSKIEEDDPFSVFRESDDTLKTFGFDEWDQAFEDHESEDDIDYGSTHIQEKHPADRLFRIPSETQQTESDLSPEPSIKKVKSDNSKKDQFKRTPPEKSKGLDQKAAGEILIIGNDLTIVTEIVDNLIDPPTGNKKQMEGLDLSDIYYGSAQFKGGYVLNIIGLSIQKTINPLIELFSNTVIGYVFVINPQNVNWTYYAYLNKIFKQKLLKPHIIALYTKNSELKYTEDSVRQKLNTGIDDQVKIIDAIDPKNAKKLLFDIFKPLYNQKQHLQPLTT